MGDGSTDPGNGADAASECGRQFFRSVCLEIYDEIEGAKNLVGLSLVHGS